MKRMKFSLLLISFIILIAIILPNVTVAATKGTVTADVLNVRNSNSINGEVIGKVTKNTQLNIKKEVGDWLEIDYQSKKGYVNKQYVSYSMTKPPTKTYQKVTIYVNGKEMTLPTEPVNIDSSLLVPYRVLAKSLEIEVNWNQEFRQVTATDDQLEVIFTIDKNEAMVNGEKKDVSPAPFIENSTTLIPLRYFSDTFGAQVEWDDVTKTVTIDRPISQKSDNEDNEELNEDELNEEEFIETSNLIGYVTANVLNVRHTPSVEANKIGELTRGTKIDIIEMNSEWVKFIYKNDVGYVYKSYIAIQEKVEVDVPIDPVEIMKNKKIVIDPGHGGKDPGAVAFGLYEKDIVLNVGLMLEQKIKASGANVIMTRYDDRLLSLKEISEIANQHNPDSFVSIHVNAATSEKPYGTETYWNRTYSSVESEQLAKSIQKQLIDKLNTYDRGIKEANFAVIRNTKSPSVLVEIGFLTNKEEAERLNDPEFQELAAEAIYQGLIDYFINN